jgi:gas vesicle protein
MIKGLLIGVATAGAVAVFTAPAAGAITNAEADYIKDLTSAGITGAQQGLIADGWTICHELASGASANDLSATYYKNSGSLSHAQADAAVNFAITDLCPAH